MENIRRLTFQPYFAWYDGWIGAYYDRKGDILYLQIIPCFGIRIYIAGPGYADRRRISPLEEEPYDNGEI